MQTKSRSPAIWNPSGSSKQGYSSSRPGMALDAAMASAAHKPLPLLFNLCRGSGALAFWVADLEDRSSCSRTLMIRAGPAAAMYIQPSPGAAPGTYLMLSTGTHGKSTLGSRQWSSSLLVRTTQRGTGCKLRSACPSMMTAPSPTLGPATSVKRQGEITSTPPAAFATSRNRLSIAPELPVAGRQFSSAATMP